MKEITLTSNAAIGENDKILSEIHQSSFNIAIQNRSISHLKKEIEFVVSDDFEYRSTGSSQELCEQLEQDFESHFSTDLKLVEDIQDQIKKFENITQAGSFNLFVATVNSNMCRRFHTDMNDLRLLCTYSGPGTLWLTEDNVDREGLKSLEEDVTIAIDESKIQQAETGSVVILKGALYPRQNTSAIVHRSPTIEESGERRLLLRIDTNEFLNF